MIRGRKGGAVSPLGQLTTRIVGGVVLLSCAVGVTSAAAQFSSVFLDNWNLGHEFSRNSARLDALAGAWVSLEDESREINMWDYGRNVAGFLLDRDAWTGDFWAKVEDIDRRASGEPSSGSVSEGGFQAAFRSYDRAIGVEGTLTQGEDYSGEESAKHTFSGPRIGVVGNLALSESLFLGLAISQIDEKEKIVSGNPLAAEHTTSRTDWQFGAVYFLSSKIDLGASLQLSNNRIKGVSQDGLHRDEYDWDRPITEYGAQIIYGAESDLQGGAYVNWTKLDGGEVLRVSWAREFFLNPSGVDLSINVPTLSEDLSASSAGTRWFYRLINGIDVGAAAQYTSGDYSVVVNPTFPSLNRTMERSFTEMKLSMGLGLTPISDLSILGQVDVQRLETDAVVLENASERIERTTKIGGGLEYFARPSLVLRGGFAWSTYADEFDFVGELTKTEYTSTDYTGGIGWSPRGGFFILDVAIGFGQRSADTPLDLVDDSDSYMITVTGRTLLR